ncbi:glycogen debranching protein [Christiangramia portivictoriae]|uniref:alpha-L-rhamnosidase-related protein n=1 Tax=Christiangramia portivictoriae TaxID=326069 RepID=UPI0006888341|nr:glycogen debranching protein [Christiangramia portivictoriae]
MLLKRIAFLSIITISQLATSQNTTSIKQHLKGVPFIEGKEAYINSPFVTAGRRTYVVGHQDGTFPEIGWHIDGEMGGIWNHPIKLFDGISAEVIIEQDSFQLDQATKFINYPFASLHLFDLKKQDIKVERWQFVSDTTQSLAIQFILKNNGKATKDLQFNFKAYSDLRPTWLGERTNMLDSPDIATYNQDQDYWMVQDRNNPWSVVIQSDLRSSYQDSIEQQYQGQGTGTLLGYNISIEPGQSQMITFFLAGSYISKSNSLKTLNYLENNLENEIKLKKAKYKQIAESSKLTIPDKNMQQAFEWIKYNSEWLVQTIPEIGTGITAGIPDYPWWFGVDSEYALKGYMAVGQTEAVDKTIRLLDSVSMSTNQNGRIIHEMSTNGAVFNKGNINETPQFASLIWEIYKWNGDRSFLEEYFPTIQKGLKWLLNENDENNNLFPDGFGMMEIHGLDSEMIDVATYTQKGFEDASKIAKELNLDDISDQYSNTAGILKQKINTEFWSEEFESYADFIGTDSQALRLIDDAIIRADTLQKPWSVSELKKTRTFIENNPSTRPRPFVLHHNWVVNTPMEMKIADSAKAIKALRTAERYTNPFGVFVTGIDRDASSEEGSGSFKGSKSFSYTGAVMTLPTGVQAIAENNYGRPDQALNYLKKMSRSFSYAFPGSMYEVSPDYGMITQAWTVYSYAIPIVQQFFGVDPFASEKLVVIKPQMPEEWENASLENIKIAENSISIYYSKFDGKITLKITQLQPEWKMKVVLPKGKYLLDGEILEQKSDKNSSFLITGKQVNISSK